MAKLLTKSVCVPVDKCWAQCVCGSKCVSVRGCLCVLICLWLEHATETYDDADDDNDDEEDNEDDEHEQQDKDKEGAHTGEDTRSIVGGVRWHGRRWHEAWRVS